MSNSCRINELEDNPKIVCERRVKTGGYCILHNPTSDKDSTDFEPELERTLAIKNCELIDLRRVWFVGKNAPFSDRLIEKEILFDYAQFYTAVPSFTKTKFQKKCSFQAAAFGRGISFDGCKFFDLVTFKSAIFDRGTAFFINTTFHSTADFSARVIAVPLRFENGCIFESGLTIENSSITSELVFESITLYGQTSFKGVGLNNATFKFTDVKFYGRTEFGQSPSFFDSNPPKFTKCDLREVRMLDLPLDVKANGQLRLTINGCTWPKKKYWFIQGRNIIADEKDIKKSPELLRAYQHLHKRYYDNSEFEQSKEFYVSFMVQKRKLREGNWLAWIFDIVFSVFSRYGESLKRPFIALIAMWFIVPILLLQLGIQLETPIRNELPKKVRMPIELSVSNENTTFIISTQEYWKAFLLNLSLSTLIRGGEPKPALTSPANAVILFETLLNGVFLGFIALANRRIFVPKKPIQSSLGDSNE